MANRRANLSTYINNVLEQHFRDCEAQIKEFKKNITIMSNNPNSPFMEKVSRSGIGRIVRYSRTAVAIIGRSKNYQKRFMSSNRINSNNRVHVSPEIFAIIERLVSAVGKDKVSMGSYVTEIIREHPERYKESVLTIYLTNTQPLF